MRITGGMARGIPLLSPKGDSVRPATDALREAVFSSLGSLVEDSRVLDLFAGTGAYGLEALSRGAAAVVAVEQSAAVLRFLEKNRAAVLKAMADGAGHFTIRRGDARRPGGEFSGMGLIFVDPPYALWPNVSDDIFGMAARLGCAQSRLVCEMAGEFFPPETPGWTLQKTLGKGQGRQPVARIYQRLSP